MAQDPKYNSELDLQFQKIIIEQVQRTQVTSISAHSKYLFWLEFFLRRFEGDF